MQGMCGCIDSHDDLHTERTWCVCTRNFYCYKRNFHSTDDDRRGTAGRNRRKQYREELNAEFDRDCNGNSRDYDSDNHCRN